MKINDKAREELLAEVNELTDDELNTKPAEDQWSVKQILEHLYRMEGGITKTIQKQLAAGKLHEVDDKPIELTVDRSTKVQAPDFAVPSVEFATLTEVKEKLAHTHAALQKFAEQTTDEQLRTKSYPHPVFGEMNLKQWIPFIAYHEMRHTEQIREVKATLGL